MFSFRASQVVLKACIALAVAGSAWSADIAIVRATKAQTIDGFGFFGGKDVWWASNSAAYFYSQPWVDLIIDDLGITIWRNEYYSEVGVDATKQDATWAKQKPTVQAIKAKADASGVPLKFFWSVWSPPSSFKCEGIEGSWGVPSTTPRPDLRWGGTLCTASQTAFADWLVAGIKLYKDIGIDMYAISFQNEPFFTEPYNSCTYARGHYPSVLKVISPIVKASYPKVKMLGAEDMLSTLMNGTIRLFPYTYEGEIHAQKATQYMDIWAYHGYSDGVNPTPASQTATLWKYAYDSLKADNKPIWQTETSGYTDNWGSDTARGAMELWTAIHTGLYYGNMSAWVHWYGSDFINSSNSTPKGKRYYALKQIFRYVRPGAVRVAATVTGSPNLFITAYEHPTMNSFVIVGMNNAKTDITVNLTGANVPAEYTLYQTTATDNCANKGTVSATNITFPAQSIVTLVNGNVYDKPVSTIPESMGMRSPVRLMRTPVNMSYGIDGRVMPGRVAGTGVRVRVTKNADGSVVSRKMVSR